MTAFQKDQAVRHRLHGEDRVVANLGETVVVRFGADLQQVEATELERVRSLGDSLARIMHRPDDCCVAFGAIA
ncbi:MAG: hypothetical protein ACLPIG_02855 [Methylocella sp.]